MIESKQVCNRDVGCCFFCVRGKLTGDITVIWVFLYLRGTRQVHNIVMLGFLSDRTKLTLSTLMLVGQGGGGKLNS